MLLGLKTGECLLNLVQTGGKDNIQVEHAGATAAAVSGGVHSGGWVPVMFRTSLLGEVLALLHCGVSLHSMSGCSVALVRARTPHALAHSVLLKKSM